MGETSRKTNPPKLSEEILILSSTTGSVSSKQVVQFGETHESSISSESISDEEDDENFSSENVNERLRHQMPVLEPIVESKQFSRVTASICTILLQVCHKEIQIVRELNNIAKSDVKLEYVPLNEKYNNADHDIDLILETSEPLLNYAKFKKDVCWIEQILRLIVTNLQADSYFDDFVKVLKDDEMTKQEENTLLTAKEFNRKELTKLRMYIEKERREWMRIIRNVTEEMANNTDLLKYKRVENIVKLNYVREWQKARDEQHKKRLQSQENNFLNTKKYMNIETQKEEQVHEEMWLYLENSLQEYKDGVEYWMEKYDADFDSKEKDVEEMKIQVETQRDKYEKLLEEYNERVKLMEEYTKRKLVLKRDSELLDWRTKAAVKIQAWWRGVMFRKHLGPYRHKKGKEKRGAKKGAGSSAKTRKK